MALEHMIRRPGDRLAKQRELLGAAQKPAGVKAAREDESDLDLAAIKLDQAAQPREHVKNERVAEYADAMKAGDQFPPLVVFHDGEVYWLADGFHRHYAAQHAGVKRVRCAVRPGSLRDAILYSVGANAKHGLERSEADKERAVLRLLNDAEWSAMTDREMAKRCRVSHPFVAKVRAKHEAVTGSVSSERTYTTKHGTVAKMKTAGINAGRTKFQAKASEDNGSITGGAGAVAGEVSRLASGRTDAGEAASADLPTESSDDRFDAAVHAFCALTVSERSDFISYLCVTHGYRINDQTNPNIGGRDEAKFDDRSEFQEHVIDRRRPEPCKEPQHQAARGTHYDDAPAESAADEISAPNSNPHPSSQVTADRPALDPSPVPASTLSHDRKTAGVAP
jgi:hypothetical protein